MSVWPVQDAKARFSEMLETCLREGPQVVSKRGADMAVLVSIEEWRTVQRARGLTAKELLLTDEARGDLNIPPRGHLRHRPPLTFDD